MELVRFLVTVDDVWKILNSSLRYMHSIAKKLIEQGSVHSPFWISGRGIHVIFHKNAASMKFDWF